MPEHHDLVEPPEEFGLEEPFDLLGQPFLHLLVAGVAVLFSEPEGFGEDRAGPGVGRHDQHDVLEVDLASETVGQVAFLHDLQQHVVDIQVRLLDLIQQHHRVRPPSNLLGQLPALFVTDVSGRRPDQPADVVLLHVLAHVDLDQGVLVPEHELGKRLGEQCLADAGGSGEQEHPGGPLGVLQPAAAASNGLRDLLDRLVLADHPCMQFVFHLQQPHGVFAREPRQRNPGHLGNDLGDDLGIDHSVGLLALLAPFAGQLLTFLLQFVGLVTEAGGLFEVLVGNGLLLGLVEPFGLFLEFLQVRRPDHRLQTDPRPGLVDHVDRLVRQAAAGDIAAGKFDGRFECVVGDLHPMVLLVPVSQPPENLDGLFIGGGFDEHGLEPPLKSPVLLDVLAVFVERRGTDALQLSA